MTPKGKAKELVEKMFNVDLDCENESMCMLYLHAVRCALIAVDEIIQQLTPIEKAPNNKSAFQYWNEVKQGIELL
jgi:hypothetical protein